MNFLAEAEGFLVVYPEQAAVANAFPVLELVSAGRPATRPRRTIAHCRRNPGTHGGAQGDASRVYVAGLSAGGALAAIMAAAYPDLYAAGRRAFRTGAGSAHDLPSALQAMQRGAPRKQAPAPATVFH